MSFVARRFGSAGLVPFEGESVWQVEDASSHESMTCPAPKESGVSLRSPVVLIVGVDDDVAALCKAFAAQVDVGFVRVSQGIAASRTIRDVRPTVVGFASSLWRDEKAAIAEAARLAGASVFELPPFLPAQMVAEQLVRAAMTDALDATG